MDLRDLPRRRVLAAAALLLLALGVAGRFLLQGGAEPALPPAPPPVPRAAPARVVVDVVGAVRRPGLYRLLQGARVADAVTRAGGPSPRANLQLVNLAAPLADGEQVVVPAQGPGVVPAAAAPATPAAPLQLSTATIEQLDALPGIGPATAQKIVDYRTAHGPFRSVDELDAIPGIGPARLEQLRGLVVP